MATHDRENDRVVSGISKDARGRIHLYTIGMNGPMYSSIIRNPDGSAEGFTRGYHAEIGWLDNGKKCNYRDSEAQAAYVEKKAKTAFAMLKKAISADRLTNTYTVPQHSLSHLFMHDALAIPVGERLGKLPKYTKRDGRPILSVETALDHFEMIYHPGDGAIQITIEDTSFKSVESVSVWPDGRVVSSIQSVDSKTGQRGDLYMLPVDTQRRPEKFGTENEAAAWHARAMQAFVAIGFRPRIAPGNQPGQ
jgi:hypothetical protein